MSRILRAESAEEVGGLKASGSAKLAPFSVKKFQSMISKDLVTKEDLDSAVKEAFTTGHRAGSEEAEKRLRAPLNSAIQNLEGILDELGQFRRELFKEVEMELLELLGLVSRKILQAELSMRPELFQDLVSRALSALDDGSSIELQINSEDQKVLGIQGTDKLKILSSAHIPRGRALISTESSGIELAVEPIINKLIGEFYKANEELVNPSQGEES